MDITKITMAYETKNFFGVYEQRFDSREWGIERKHVLKALNFLMADSFTRAVHFDLLGGVSDGGTHEVFYQECHQRGTDMLTWVHHDAANSKDIEEISLKEAKRMTREWGEEE